jgi:hypothetical protein
LIDRWRVVAGDPDGRTVPGRPDTATTSPGEADAVVLNPTDYFFWLPMPPESPAVLRAELRWRSATHRRVRVMLGQADGIDVDARTVSCAARAAGAARWPTTARTGCPAASTSWWPSRASPATHGLQDIPETLHLRDDVIPGRGLLHLVQQRASPLRGSEFAPKVCGIASASWNSPMW